MASSSSSSAGSSKRLRESGPSPAPRAEVVHVAFDIETTGQYVGNDEMFAIGVAASDGQRYQVALDLGKKAGESWRELWMRRGFEMRCYDEFWSKHEDTLNRLQNPEHITVCPDNQAMMDKLVGVLKRIEAGAEKVVPWSDTLFFDSVWISTKMIDAGYESMMYRRDHHDRDWEKPWHCMMWGREVNSYLCGALGAEPSSAADTAAVTQLKREIEKEYEGKGFHERIVPHEPQYDAEKILALVLGGMERAKKMRRE